MSVRAFFWTAAGLLFFPFAARGAEPGNAEALARKKLDRIAEINGPVVAVALSPDGKRLASGGLGRFVRLWDAATGQELRQLEHPRGIYCLAFSADNKLLATAGDRRIRIWETGSGREIRCLKVRSGESFCLAFSPDGQTLATAGEMIRLWDPITGRERGRLDNHLVPVLSLAFSPDGKTLASGGEDGVLRLWDATRRQEIRRWSYELAVTCLAFSPDSQTLAAGSADGTVRLWTPTDGKNKLNLRVTTSQGGPCLSLAFSTDGKTLAGGSRGDGRIPRWDTASGKERPSLQGFQGATVPVAFHPDSRPLAGDNDPLAKLWDVADLNKKVHAPSFRFATDELTLLWEDLASNRDILAATAVETLSVDSELVVPFLQERLRPESPYPSLPKLIAELDSNRFPVRQRATEQLERLGPAAEPALRQALRARPPLEVKRRIEMLLARIDQNGLPPDISRACNAIRVLYRLRTPEARLVLKKLAGGAPEGLITRSAKEALQKLNEK